MFEIAPLILLFPLLGLFVNIAFGRRMGERYSGLVGIIAVLAAFVIALTQLASLFSNNFAAHTVLIADWMHIGNFYLPWEMRIDTLSVTMMMLVTGVGSLIHIYASGYMHGDPRFSRFFVYLNMFVAAMLILVTSNSYLGLFVGWEGVGVCSYLLIGFWYDKGKSGTGNAKAARKAFVTNRVGDFGFLIAMFLLFWYTGSLRYDEVFHFFEGAQPAAVMHDENAAADTGHETETAVDAGHETETAVDAGHETETAVDAGHETETSGHNDAGGHAAATPHDIPTWLATAIALLFLVGVAGKSAQIPLFIWLPDAMAGPTPVSALIHAATMVTAGIYLVCRSAVIFELAPSAQMVVTLVGASTALLAGSIAMAQWDIKKVLAYSTISQLGFMVAAIGLGGYVAGMFHLLTHAFFKALLFLSSGSVIHGMEHGHHHLHSHGDDAHGHADDAHAAHDDHHADAHAHADHGHHAEEDASNITSMVWEADLPAAHDDFDPQDMRTMGALRHRMPITFVVYVIGSIALAGVFPLAGFWSKDEILADAWHKGIALGQWHGVAAYVLLTIAAFFTAFYMTRQVFLTFFGKPRHAAAEHAHESPAVMTVPLIILAVLSVLGGALNFPEWVPFPLHESLGNWLAHTHHFFHTLPFNSTVALISTVVGLLAIVLGYGFYGKGLAKANTPDPLQRLAPSIFGFLSNKWYIDELYQVILIRPVQWLGKAFAYFDWDVFHDWFHEDLLAGGYKAFSGLLAQPIDRGIVNNVFEGGLAGIVNLFSGKFFRKLQSGFVRNYALGIMFGVVLILGYVVWSSLQ